VSWGDPHFFPFKSANYELQTFNEYVVAKDVNIGYEVQGRLSPCGSGIGISGVLLIFLSSPRSHSHLVMMLDSRVTWQQCSRSTLEFSSGGPNFRQ
jgi:hypothetical protein